MYNIVINRPECLVVDNFLSDSDWEKLYNQVQIDSWSKVNNASDKYWHLTDGDAYKTQRLISKNFPFKSNYDIWFHRFNKLLATDIVKNFVGEIVGYSCRGFAYPVGGKNPWHDDMGVMTYAFYLHKKWQINWDGTLLIIPKNSIKYSQLLDVDKDSKGLDEYSKANTPMEMFSQEEKYKEIIDHGTGFFVSPKPNRLVIINKDVVHGINRVDPDAGENVRLSIGGGIIPSDYKGPINFQGVDNNISPKKQ